VIAVTALVACTMAVCAGLYAMHARPDSPSVASYGLEVDPTDYAEIAEASASSSDEHPYRRWVPARFSVRGRAWDVEVALDRRGDRPVWIVHFHGTDTYHGMRDLELVLAGDASDAGAVVAGERARSLGLLAAPNGFAVLSINGSESGVVRWTEGRSNSMLMRLGYDEGEVYSISTAELDEGRIGASVQRVELVRRPFADREKPRRRAAAKKLRRLIELALEASDAEFEREIGQLLNVDKYISWNSLAWLFGSPSADVGTGAQWYYDPVTGLFEPLVTDLGRRAVAISYASFSDTHLSPIGTRLFRIPRYREERNRALWALLSDPEFDVAQASEHRFAGLLPHLARASESWPQIPGRRELLRHQRESNAVLAHNAERLRRILAPATIEAERGMTFVGGLEARGASPTYQRAAAVRTGVDPWQMVSQRATYVRAVARSEAGSQGMAASDRADAREIARVVEASGLPFRVQGEELVLPAGIHHLRQDLIVPPTARLVLEPGVTLQLDPDVSVLTFRELTALGTVEQPIRIEPAQDGRSWGSFGVVHARKVSRVEHVVVRGGSAKRVEGIDLSGQLSFNASDLELRHSEFQAARGGEGLSIKRASFDISRSSFFDNALDGLDLEWAKGSVRESHFADNADDGIDMAGSSVRIWECSFRGMADKGISAGEGSRVRLADSKIELSKIAIASKEGSIVNLVRTEISRNEVGFSLYRDKPIFGAAFGRIRGGQFSDNLRDIRIESGSQIALQGVNDSFGAVFDELARRFTVRPAFASAAQ
jgi:hypothetical protein